MKVYIMRGIPGSGKTTWVEQNVSVKVDRRPGGDEPRFTYPHVKVCSADNYHMIEGKYVYKPENARAAHDKCLTSFLDTLLEEPKFDALVVDNTNTTLWELAPYVRLCEVYGADYEVVTLWIDPLVACSRQVHDVPAATVMRMHRQLIEAELPSWWRHKVVVLA